MAEVLIKNLHKVFDRTEVVSGIDLSIKDKEFVDLKINWLIDNDRADLIESFLKQNDNDENLRKYATAQLQAMRACTGHIFWSYKVSEDFSGWNFRKLVERNVIDMKEFCQ